MNHSTNAVCRGAWALGSACGHCDRCIETRPSLAWATATDVDLMGELQVLARADATIRAVWMVGEREGWSRDRIFLTIAAVKARESETRLAMLVRSLERSTIYVEVPVNAPAGD